MSRRMDHLVREGVERGIFAAGTQADTHRPWPVLVMSGIGAWFAAIPLVAFMVAVVASGSSNAGLAIGGAVVLVAAVLILRVKTLPVFVEQLCLPLLIAGMVLLGAGLPDLLSRKDITPVLLAVACALAWATPRNWLRMLWGVAIGALLVAALAPSLHGGWPNFWPALYGASAAWLLGCAGSHWSRQRHLIGTAAMSEAVLSGAAVSLLCSLAVLSSLSVVVGGAVDPASSFHDAGSTFTLWRSVSVAAAVAALAWAAWRWPVLRSIPFAAVGVVLAALSAFSLALGATALIGIVCLTSGRRVLASLAGLCALWLLGHFYYQLAWPLAHKALLLAAAGAALALIAGFALPHERVRETTSPEPVPALREGRQRWLIGAATLAVLAVVNFSIWQKEALISQGAPVFVELAPVDPRSLMQGDYMRLNFSLPGANGQATRRASHVVARVGPNGVARLLRLHDGGALAPGDILIELVYKHGHPMLVTDAWYFTEGEAKRWGAAKYGEFRVQPDGRALLVGLRGANLQPM